MTAKLQPPKRSKTTRLAYALSSTAYIPTPEEVKATRQRAGMSQQEFGELAYVHSRTVGGWEKGRQKPHPAAWALICIRLGLVYAAVNDREGLGEESSHEG